MNNVPPASKVAQQQILDTLRQHGQLRLESIAHFSEHCHATTHRAVQQLEKADLLYRRNMTVNGRARVLFGAKPRVEIPVGDK